jgi:hypothetical protein
LLCAWWCLVWRSTHRARCVVALNPPAHTTLLASAFGYVMECDRLSCFHQQQPAACILPRPCALARSRTGRVRVEKNRDALQVQRAEHTSSLSHSDALVQHHAAPKQQNSVGLPRRRQGHRPGDRVQHVLRHQGGEVAQVHRPDPGLEKVRAQECLAWGAACLLGARACECECAPSLR